MPCIHWESLIDFTYAWFKAKCIYFILQSWGEQWKLDENGVIPATSRLTGLTSPMVVVLFVLFSISLFGVMAILSTRLSFGRKLSVLLFLFLLCVCLSIRHLSTSLCFKLTTLLVFINPLSSGLPARLNANTTTENRQNSLQAVQLVSSVACGGWLVYSTRLKLSYFAAVF